ncbi:hypothetical protein [Wenzhouxiangella marina]|uniref:Uncharacterized protein n=1 Tax=Wenzhouxiangella marina TaxID=1579979 RepID=A0A0K0XZJ9_9GAMM|nr:hypothetical protein [Wenzhouxiangella marina]AKS43113.1 hypothetical protein WM2015_2756 [Wenzhouxiangella marina]MBB6087202.1 hypothetical protein [Wenzhouxiangella marina]
MKILMTVATALLLSTAALASNTGVQLPPTISATVANFNVTGTQTDGSSGQCQLVTINITADVTGVNDLGGGNDQVRFSIFDDGSEVVFEVVDVPVGATESLDVTLQFEGVIGAGAPGVGVLIFDGADVDFGNVLADLDPFDPDVVPGACGSAGPAFSVPVNSPWMISGLAALLALLAFGVIRSRA